MIYEETKEFLKSGDKVVFIKASTGIGKTIAVLSPLLEKKLRVLWFTRTHKEQEVIEREVGLINEKFNTDFKHVALKGIKHLCLHEDVKSSPFPHQRCSI